MVTSQSHLVIYNLFSLRSYMDLNSISLSRLHQELETIDYYTVINSVLLVKEFLAIITLSFLLLSLLIKVLENEDKNLFFQLTFVFIK